MRHAAQRLIKVIEVRAVLDTYLITINLESADPKIAAEMVNALAQAYLERHGQQELDLNRERLHQLTDRKSQLEKQIQDRSVQLNQLAEELGTSSLDPMMGNPNEKRPSETATPLDGAKHAWIRA